MSKHYTELLRHIVWDVIKNKIPEVATQIKKVLENY